MKVRTLLLTAIVATALVLPSNLFAGSYLRVLSWNARHMGWSGETNWSGYADQAWEDFGSSSSAGNGVDVIFLQEVMYSSSASSFASAMTSRSGVTWSYKVTSAIGRSSYKERYAVVYRTDRVSILSQYVWSDSGDKFEREPQIVKLRHKNTGADYTFINWHCIWGTTTQRKAEINAIADVFKSIQNASSSDQDVILLGDFNRNATSSYFSRLKSTSVISPQVSYKVNSNTTINSSCAFANPYDHFFMQTAYVTEYSSAGRDYISGMCTFRNNLSDHAPIWLKLYSTSDTD
ncbi:endonuclease/exonuclease/phosphatase family protein [bacterium]|nr:endonuclease/exonuclease/phosphatase family protein [bacterium]